MPLVSGRCSPAMMRLVVVSSSSRRRRAIVASGPGLPRRRGCSGVTVEGGPFTELSSREVRPWELRCEAADAEDMDSCETKGWTRRARERGSKPWMEWTGGELGAGGMAPKVLATAIHTGVTAKTPGRGAAQGLHLPQSPGRKTRHRASTGPTVLFSQHPRRQPKATYAD